MVRVLKLSPSNMETTLSMMPKLHWSEKTMKNQECECIRMVQSNLTELEQFC